MNFSRYSGLKPETGRDASAQRKEPLQGKHLGSLNAGMAKAWDATIAQSAEPLAILAHRHFHKRPIDSAAQMRPNKIGKTILPLA
ncbi:hypothetical protein A8L48_04980 [Rhizobium rhizogenes]|nr:hypothetical protein B0909_22550 [Rhizobium rhizogenes]OAM62231.1 hypothetical protein A8L48_04980 [Rhizobium rhizogenes]